MSEGIDRRTTLVLLGGASAAALGAGGAHAQAPGMDTEQLAEGIEQRVIGEGESRIPGFAKVRVRDITFQPGARAENTMENPMICHMTSGTLQVTIDGEAMEMPEGTVWSCNTGTVEANANESDSPAVMRVADLLPE